MECPNCKKLKDELSAAIGFLEAEMGWEYFRAEFFEYDKEPKTSASAENARKLRNFLLERGYRKKDA